MSKEVPKPQATAITNRPDPLQLVEASRTTNTDLLNAEAQMRPSGLVAPSGISNVELTSPVDASYRDLEAPSMVSRAVLDAYAKTQMQLRELSIPSTSAYDVASNFAPQLQSGLPDPLLQHGQHPGLAAGGEDWAFQGIDIAFFDSLMKGTGNDGNQDAEWITWQR
jgi:hypothetical protein